MNDHALLEINRLQIQMDTPRGVINAVKGFDLSIKNGEIFALVGESGCGKTMTSLAITRLLPQNAAICTGSEIFLEGVPLHHISEAKMQLIRKNKIGMIFQDPSAALNPVMTVAEQLQECLKGVPRHEMKLKMIDLLEKVHLADPIRCLAQYPHELSGGMKQRVMIAMALSRSPVLLIADEPTTALDVTTQAQVLSLIRDLNQQLKMAILLITHDLGIVAEMADRVGVMYAGHLVEQASKKDFFGFLKHPYSQKLFASLPDYTPPNEKLIVIPGQVPILDHEFGLCRFKDRCSFVFKACEQLIPRMQAQEGTHAVRCHWYDERILAQYPKAFRVVPCISQMRVKLDTDYVQSLQENNAPLLLSVRDLKVHFPIRRGFLKRPGIVRAVDGVSFDLFEGRTLALVGESGSGKTTVAKGLMRLIDHVCGEINFLGKDLLKLSTRQIRYMRADFQMIFQDPLQAMDPKMRVSDIIKEGMIALNIGSNLEERDHRVDILLEQVGLSAHYRSRTPQGLSGGQRQRVAIARALAVGARLLICDEPTSALDVSVQAQILNLLKSLQQDLVISVIFITHNISVVNYLAQDIAVMHAGRIVEYGKTAQVLNHPQHAYTKSLIAAVPRVARLITY